MKEPSKSPEKRQALGIENGIKHCNLCKKPFFAKFKKRRYCPDCPPSKRPKYGATPKVERYCGACGVRFLPKNENFSVCSKACSVEFKRIRKSEIRLPRYCRECGDKFKPGHNPLDYFCTKKKCADKAHILHTLDGSASKVQAICTKCHKPFHRGKTMNAHCRRCSPKGRNQEISRICAFCEEPFSKAGKGFYKYCPACKEKYPKQMPYKSKKPCEGCGQHYFHVNKESRFCSLSCSSAGINREGLGPRHDDAELLDRLIKVIQNHKECLSMEELAYSTGTSTVVFAPRGWTMEGLYQAAGRTYDKPQFRSRFEDRVYTVLCGLVDKSKIESQKALPGMRGVKGGCLLADFYIDELRLMIEVDGNHHREPHWGPETLEYVQANDRQKDAYAKANGITLLRIPYTENRRKIRAQLLRTIRHLRPARAPLNPSNHLGKDGDSFAKSSTRRVPKRKQTGDRPNPQ